MKYIIKKVQLKEGKLLVQYETLNSEITIKTDNQQVGLIHNALQSCKTEFEILTGINLDEKSISEVVAVIYKENVKKGTGVQLVVHNLKHDNIEATEIKSPVVWENSSDARENMRANLFELTNEIRLEANDFIDRQIKPIKNPSLFNKEAS